MRNTILVFILLSNILLSDSSFAGDINIKPFCNNPVVKVSAPAINVATGVYEVYKSKDDEKLQKAGEVAAKTTINIVVEGAAIPAAVATASSLGVTASTGTAIGSLSGAAATSATLSVIGGPASIALGTVGIVVSPVVIGGVIVVGIGAVIAAGINKILF